MHYTHYITFAYCSPFSPWIFSYKSTFHSEAVDNEQGLMSFWISTFNAQGLICHIEERHRVSWVDSMAKGTRLNGRRKYIEESPLLQMFGKLQHAHCTTTSLPTWLHFHPGFLQEINFSILKALGLKWSILIKSVRYGLVGEPKGLPILVGGSTY